MAEDGSAAEPVSGWLSERRRALAAASAALVVGVLVLLVHDTVLGITLLDAAVLVLWAYLLVYLIITIVVFTRTPDPQIRRWANREARGSWLERYLFGTAPGPGTALFFAAAAQIVAMLWMPGSGGASVHDGTRMAIAAVLIVLAWMSIVVCFAVTFYADDVVDKGGLDFPGEKPQGWSDYVYFAAAVMATFGTTDVSVTSREMRRTVTANGVIAFVFNTVTVAITVSALQTL